MIAVDSHPITRRLGRDVKRPITSGLAESSIITTMMGTAITPFTTAAQKSALMGSTGVNPRPTPTSVAPERIV